MDLNKVIEIIYPNKNKNNKRKIKKEKKSDKSQMGRRWTDIP